MTELLQQALTEVQKLAPAEQDAIAAIILDELEDERRWDETFARSQDEIARLASRVRDDIRAGRVRKTRADELGIPPSRRNGRGAVLDGEAVRCVLF